MTHRPRPWARPLLALTVLGPLSLAGLLVSGCAAPDPGPALSPDDTVKAATQLLTDRCLTARGLTPPRPGRRPGTKAQEEHLADALFGAGRTELSLRLPTGYSVRAHTDGCLASAQRALYGDQRRWFQVSTVVNNLKPEAAYRKTGLASVRAGHRTEIADWQRLRAHALTRATHLLTDQPRTP
ncbi:hypothetical protein [Streptomyces sp. CB01635]|uniref:hypothetical protein n=1 Tax=unclassified Streptomyces TaxID=2593676 RepID=UPI001F3E0EA8|nr:hypothetical protein [Streptomyces sp. CB01635]